MWISRNWMLGNRSGAVDVTLFPKSLIARGLREMIEKARTGLGIATKPQGELTSMSVFEESKAELRDRRAEETMPRTLPPLIFQEQ